MQNQRFAVYNVPQVMQNQRFAVYGVPQEMTNQNVLFKV